MPYVYPLIAVAALALGFGSGWKTHAWKTDAAQLEQTKAEARTALIRAEKVDTVAARLESTRTTLMRQQSRVATETVYVVKNDFYAGTCFDDDGLRNLASAYASDPAASEPAHALRDPGPTDDR